MTADLEVLEATWRLHRISARELHDVAGQLLDEGIEADSVIDLFAIPPDVLDWEGPAAFEKVLRDLGGGDMTEAEAAQTMARHIGRDVLAGTLEPSQATSLASSIYVGSGYRLENFYPLYVLDEEMSDFSGWKESYLGRSRAEVERDVRSEARRLAES